MYVSMRSHNEPSQQGVLLKGGALKQSIPQKIYDTLLGTCLFMLAPVLLVMFVEYIKGGEMVDFSTSLMFVLFVTASTLSFFLATIASIVLVWKRNMFPSGGLYSLWFSGSFIVPAVVLVCWFTIF